jgi:hypothetical protein
MSLADSTVSALKAFAIEVGTWTNQGSLKSIGDHIATIENAAAQDVHAGETAAKAVWAELYGAFHGHDTEPLAEAPAAPAPAVEPVVAAPLPPVGGTDATPRPTVVASAPVAVDPTPAPSTTEAVSSAPSSETSTASSTATETPAAPAA